MTEGISRRSLALAVSALVVLGVVLEVVVASVEGFLRLTDRGQGGEWVVRRWWAGPACRKATMLWARRAL